MPEPAHAPLGDGFLVAGAETDASSPSLVAAAKPRGDIEDAAAARAPGSQSDAVLASAMVVGLGDINLSDRLVQLLQGDELQRRFEEIERRALEAVEARRHSVSTSIVATGTLSIGYVVWLVRGGVLMSSMLSALPAWQMVDPLPVLTAAGARGRRRGAAGADEGDVERLFDEAGDLHSKATQSAKAGKVGKAGKAGNTTHTAPFLAALPGQHPLQPAGTPETARSAIAEVRS